MTDTIIPNDYFVKKTIYIDKVFCWIGKYIIIIILYIIFNYINI